MGHVPVILDKRGKVVRRTGSYYCYTPGKVADNVYRFGREQRVYEDTGYGLRVRGKATSQRDRHRAAVRVMEHVPERALKAQTGVGSRRDECDKRKAAERTRQEVNLMKRLKADPQYLRQVARSRR